MRKFKYQPYLDQLKVPCPPVDYGERETIAYRWVFDKIDDEKKFKPQYLKNPNRFQNSSQRSKCRAIGLSVFDAEENAKAAYKRIKRRSKGKGVKLGTNLAFGKLSMNEGVCGTTDSGGHFTFHPYQEASLEQSFKIISKL